jgi:hypothetical protein
MGRATISSTTNQTMSNDTKVIPVWITPREVAHITQPMGWAADIYAYEIAPPCVASTLIIGDKAMPMREVVKMLEEAQMVARAMGGLTLSKEEATRLAKHDFAIIAAKYGVDLTAHSA